MSGNCLFLRQSHHIIIVSLIIIVVVMAIPTGKIERRNFKDTKKVNAYMFMFIMISTLMPLWLLVDRIIGNKVLGTFSFLLVL